MPGGRSTAIKSIRTTILTTCHGQNFHCRTLKFSNVHDTIRNFNHNLKKKVKNLIATGTVPLIYQRLRDTCAAAVAHPNEFEVLRTRTSLFVRCFLSSLCCEQNGRPFAI